MFGKTAQKSIKKGNFVPHPNTRQMQPECLAIPCGSEQAEVQYPYTVYSESVWYRGTSLSRAGGYYA